MKKIIYKSIFFIVLVLFVFLMLPNKQVKAQEQEEQTFPEVIMKVPYYSASFTNEYTTTYEFIVRYRLDNILFPFDDNLNENDYFLVATRGATQKGITSTANLTPSYVLEEIQIEDNSTIFVVRFQIGKTFVYSWYGGAEYMFIYFENDSAFYIKYNVYQYGYDLGYMVGYGDGYNLGLDDGYWNGHNDGYDYGYNVGYDDGENAGYVIGYNEGYDYGYNVGYDNGKEYGIDFGRKHWYNVGYEAGYNNGFNEGIKENWEFSRFLKSIFAGIGSFLGINLLPGISIGAIIAVPIIFGIIAFILGKKKD